MSEKAPCKNCEKRVLGCHVTCEDYIYFKKKVDDVNEKRRHYNDTTYMGRGRKFNKKYYHYFKIYN